MKKEVEESIRMIKHSFVEGTFVRLNINTGEEIPLTAEMCLEPIIKDLEILEILCNHLSAFLGTGENDSGTQKVILLRGNILENDKDYQKIKECLEENKNE